MAIGILISFTLQAIAPVSVEITNSQVVKDAQQDAIAPRMGPAGANLTVVLFTDYRSPACRRYDPAMFEAG